MKFCSTESTLLKVYSDLNLAVVLGHVTLVELLDLSAAFDTIDHDVLLKWVQMLYEISGSPLICAKSYVANRVQAIVVNSS